MLSMMTAAMLSVSATTMAQNSNGGLFERGQSAEIESNGMFNAYGNRDTYNGTFSNETFGAPLGGGLLMLTIAAAGYALKRRKEDEK